MEAILITRNPGTDRNGNLTTSDRTLDLGKKQREAVDTLPASEWSTSTAPHAHRGAAATADEPRDASYKPHALSGFAAFGSDEPNELATFVQGREAWEGNAEGFLLTSQLSTGFAGVTSGFLETLRDEFPKSAVWLTALLSDARGWKRSDSERAKAQRTLNEALGLVHAEELASMVLPVQPVQTYEAFVEGRERDEWRRFLRDDVDTAAAYQQVLTTHLQSAGSELREPDVLPSLIEQLNWRGGTKLASLSGHTPLAPAAHYGPTGSDAAVRKLRAGERDWSVWRGEGEGAEEEDPKDEEAPYAQYSVVRGLDFEESQEMGPLLEKAAEPLKEPLVRWVSLPDPFPILPSSLPIYRGLHPSTGHPLLLPVPSTALPLSLPSALAPSPAPSAALFGLPDARFPPALSFTTSQPSSIPVLTTLSTRPSARLYPRALSLVLREMRRVRAGVLREYESGEYGVGREGVEEARERLEGLWDGYGGAGEGEDKGEDEDWTATEGVEEEWDL
ncbi:mtDNA inheritance, partitioning of the mitochondrial organelle [Rhodotorula kratochvilovae]